MFVGFDPHTGHFNAVLLNKLHHRGYDLDSELSGGKYDTWFVVEFKFGPPIVGTRDFFVGVFADERSELVADCFRCEKII